MRLSLSARCMCFLEQFSTACRGTANHIHCASALRLQSGTCQANHARTAHCGSMQAREASRETLEELASFLPHRFPGMFQSTGSCLANTVTGLKWDLDDPQLNPLAVCSQLVQVREGPSALRQSSCVPIAALFFWLLPSHRVVEHWHCVRTPCCSAIDFLWSRVAADRVWASSVCHLGLRGQRNNIHATCIIPCIAPNF